MAETLSFWEAGLSESDRARRMVSAAKIVQELPSETYRRDQDLKNVRLYENNSSISIYDYAGRYYSDQTNIALPAPEQSKNNRAKSAIDTFASQVFATDQRARFRVVDGSYKQSRRSRELQNFTDGLVHELKLHALKKRAGKDSAIFESGVGVIQFYRDKRKKGDRAAAQRVLPTELGWDPRDGLVDGMPRTIYRGRPIPRDKVLADFGDGPEGAVTKRIQAARAVVSSAATEDLWVYEAETLPTSEGSGDGWHIVALDVQDGALLVEPYDKDHHSFVFIAIEPRTTTGWGLSMMHQVRDLQIGINANVYRADRIRKLYSAGHLYVNKTAGVEKSKLTNEIGSVWEGNAPAAEAMSFIQFQGATADIDAAIERDGQRIFENLGVNIGASTGDTSRGLGASAAAMREETVKTDKRNSERQQRWEQFHLDCVHAALSIVRDIVGEGRSGYKVSVPGKGRQGMTKADWKEAAMDEEDYILEIQPASPVPTEPAGLMAMGREMIDLGAWSPDELGGYMQDLDADGRINRKQAQRRNLEKTFEALLYEAKASAAPDEFTNLQLAMQIGVDYLSQGEEDGVPEKHLERVRRYLKRCKALMQPPAPPAAVKPAAPGPEQAAPGAPPMLAAV